jgi:hypothetical protein
MQSHSDAASYTLYGWSLIFVCLFVLILCEGISLYQLGLYVEDGLCVLNSWDTKRRLNDSTVHG